MNDNSVARVGVLGATGYTGRELVGLLAGHSQVEIAFATSQSEAGRPLQELCRPAPDLSLVRAEDAPLAGCDVVFSCLPHGESLQWAGEARQAGARVVDLSADLRVRTETTPSWAHDARYGLPELHRECLRHAELIANPGCYPTAALLALAPLIRRGFVAGPVMINAASGVTGAGRTAKRELLFAEVAEDFRAYAVGNTHRHLAEMREQVAGLVPNGGGPAELVFTPHLLPVRRGILETIYVPVHEMLPAEKMTAPWTEDYADEPFIDILQTRMPGLHDVVGTNRVAIGATHVAGVSTPLLLVIAAIDNLRKGAAGQAVQNLNLMMGRPETEGLL
jgi:N-acetyl-gamma-glutamyl-phosphate reductase